MTQIYQKLTLKNDKYFFCRKLDALGFLYSFHGIFSKNRNQKFEKSTENELRLLKIIIPYLLVKELKLQKMEIFFDIFPKTTFSIHF